MQRNNKTYYLQKKTPKNRSFLFIGFEQYLLKILASI